MQFNPDLPPAMRKSPNAAETQNERNIVQAMLMMRSPQGEVEWANRYTRVFRDLFNTDDFYELVKSAHLEQDKSSKSALLTKIQERLDAELETNPRFD